MKTKLLVIMALILIIFSIEGIAQKKKIKTDSNPLVGKWETVPNPLEASSLSLDFRKNKSFSYLLESNWNGKYKLEGTKLITITSIPILNKTKTDSSTVLIYSDTLVQISKVKGKDVTSKMVRHSRTSKLGGGIIGTWVMHNSDAEHSTIDFKSDGTFHIKNILKTFKGNYLVKQDTVTVFSYGMLMMKNKFILDRGQLWLYGHTQSAPIKLEKSKK